jgi:hypothetical protein
MGKFGNCTVPDSVLYILESAYIAAAISPEMFPFAHLVDADLKEKARDFGQSKMRGGI